MAIDRKGELPVFPNVVPYNELLLRGDLGIGEYGVKTREWSWGHRGPVLLYNSTRTDKEVASVHGIDVAVQPRKAIVGVGELTEVRELTDAETIRMLQNFNWISRKYATLIFERGGFGWDESGVYPMAVGFFFLNLQRFSEPVSYVPPRGAVSLSWVRRRGALDEQLKGVGY